MHVALRSVSYYIVMVGYQQWLATTDSLSGIHAKIVIGPADSAQCQISTTFGIK